MKAEDLKAECERRGLDTTPLPGERGTCKTRPQMILMIREYIELKNTLSEETPDLANPAAKPRPRPSTAPRRSADEEDWDMVRHT